jgi:hypothetical protein
MRRARFTRTPFRACSPVLASAVFPEPAAPSIPARWSVEGRGVPALPRVARVRYAHHALTAGEWLVARLVPPYGSALTPQPWRPFGRTKLSRDHENLRFSDDRERSERAGTRTARARGGLGPCDPLEPPRANAPGNRPQGGTERGRPLDEVRRRKHCRPSEARPKRAASRASRAGGGFQTDPLLVVVVVVRTAGGGFLHGFLAVVTERTGNSVSNGHNHPMIWGLKRLFEFTEGRSNSPSMHGVR